MSCQAHVREKLILFEIIFSWNTQLHYRTPTLFTKGETVPIPRRQYCLSLSQLWQLDIESISSVFRTLSDEKGETTNSSGIFQLLSSRLVGGSNIANTYDKKTGPVKQNSSSSDAIYALDKINKHISFPLHIQSPFPPQIFLFDLSFLLSPFPSCTNPWHSWFCFLFDHCSQKYPNVFPRNQSSHGWSFCSGAVFLLDNSLHSRVVQENVTRSG